jgi:inner membrane protein
VDLNFDVALELQGMESLSFLPTGKSTRVDLNSPWPHPKFEGRFLPKTREISGEGFSARWETSFFSSNMLEHLESCIRQNQCNAFQNNSFGVSLHQGVDIYLQAERSVKYALLFVGLTFVAFLLFEILKGLRIHAVQYGLVGIALALFYLLLISLSEHIAFGLSYIIASIACVSLISFYVSFVLRSAARGLIFAGTLSGLYGALYMLIRSEDYALLMGSGLLFGVLTFIMVITRDIDWYKIEAGAKQQLVKSDNK